MIATTTSTSMSVNPCFDGETLCRCDNPMMGSDNEKALLEGQPRH
jgi:hypothetical protein